MKTANAVALTFSKPIELGILASISSSLTTTDLLQLCPDLAKNKVNVHVVNDFLLELNSALQKVGVVDDSLNVVPSFLATT